MKLPLVNDQAGLKFSFKNLRMIWSNGTTSTLMPGRKQFERKQAVVSFPGTAIFLLLISVGVKERVETSIGP